MMSVERRKTLLRQFKKALDEVDRCYDELVAELGRDGAGNFRDGARIEYVSPLTGAPGACIPAGVHRPFRHGQQYPPGWPAHLQVHVGVDGAGAIGTPIYAAAEGVVLDAAKGGGTWGNLVNIGHDDGLVTRYAHLDKILCTPGGAVYRGQRIGTMGGPPHFAPHLHFEVVRRALYEASFWDWWDGRLRNWKRNQGFYIDPEIHISAR